jgi:DnaJ family protein C protein 9
MSMSTSGSEEEVQDIKAAYKDHNGSIDEIMRHIMHSTYEDEARFIVLIEGLINKGELKATKLWKATAKDEKARLVREKQGKKEAGEAEALAKELGVWDEFYGSGKEGARRGKGKGQNGKGKSKSTSNDDDGDVDDTSALQALILKKNAKKNMDGFFDSLAAKYGEPEPPSKGKKGKRKRKDTDADEAEAEGSSNKKSKATSSLADIPDDEFEALQQRMFGDKGKLAAPALAKEKKNAKGRKAK